MLVVLVSTTNKDVVPCNLLETDVAGEQVIVFFVIVAGKFPEHHGPVNESPAQVRVAALWSGQGELSCWGIPVSHLVPLHVALSFRQSHVVCHRRDCRRIISPPDLQELEVLQEGSLAEFLPEDQGEVGPGRPRVKCHEDLRVVAHNSLGLVAGSLVVEMGPDVLVPFLSRGLHQVDLQLLEVDCIDLRFRPHGETKWIYHTNSLNLINY